MEDVPALCADACFADTGRENLSPTVQVLIKELGKHSTYTPTRLSSQVAHFLSLMGKMRALLSLSEMVATIVELGELNPKTTALRLAD